MGWYTYIGLHKDMTEGNRVEDVQIKILTCLQCATWSLETMATIATERMKCQQKIAIVKIEERRFWCMWMSSEYNLCTISYA